ncbi:ribosomal RNA small subunit methyltransferase A [bacterium]|nr:ribosomal RNA small subunit methyltransferase A [bacterium]
MEPILYSRFAVRRLLAKLGHPPRKALGQHFLYSQPTLERLVHLAQLPRDLPVIEIGPGLGHLTHALLSAGYRVVAVELDRVLAQHLVESRDLFGELSVHCADALAVSLGSLVPESPRFCVAGNLPYYASSKLLFHLLEEGERIARMGLMLQEEVALRMVAPPGGKDYGRLSVMCQYWGEPKLALRVSRRNFFPVPEVDSAFVVWTPERRRPAKDEGAFRRLVASAFAERRKMLKSMPVSAGGGAAWTREALLSACGAAGIEPTRRAETLSVQEFLDLADALATCTGGERERAPESRL